jgi:hypothetical protein
LEWEDLFGKQVMQNAPWEKWDIRMGINRGK